MSLINQMLKDLDLRRQDAVDSTEVLVQGLAAPKYRSYREPSRYSGVMALLISGLAILMVVAWYITQPYTDKGIKEMNIPSSLDRQTDVTPDVIHERNDMPIPAAHLPSNPSIRQIDEGQDDIKLAKLEISHEEDTIGQKSNEQPILHNETVEDRVRNTGKITASKIPGADKKKDFNNQKEIQAIPHESPTVDKKFHSLTSQESAEIIYRRGVSLAKKGQLDKAEDELRKALVQYPAHARAREMLTGVLLKQGKKDQAIVELAEGFSVDPHQITISKLYARLLIEAGDNELALQVLEKGKPPIVQDPEYYAFLAAVYQRANHYEQASAVYSELVSLEPGQGIWWLGLGVSLESQRKFNDAVTAFQRAKKSGQLRPDLLQFINNRIATLKIKAADSAA